MNYNRCLKPGEDSVFVIFEVFRRQELMRSVGLVEFWWRLTRRKKKLRAKNVTEPKTLYIKKKKLRQKEKLYKRHWALDGEESLNEIGKATQHKEEHNTEMGWTTHL